MAMYSKIRSLLSLSLGSTFFVRSASMLCLFLSKKNLSLRRKQHMVDGYRDCREHDVHTDSFLLVGSRCVQCEYECRRSQVNWH